MSSSSLAQFNLSSVCLRYLPLSFLLPLSHVLSLFISFSPALCLRNYESVSRQATYSQDTFQFDINNKQRATPVPSTPSSPKYLKKTTYSLPSSPPLSTLSVSLCLLLLLSKHSGDSERLFCSSFVSLKCALATWLQLFILLAEIY